VLATMQEYGRQASLIWVSQPARWAIYRVGMTFYARALEANSCQYFLHGPILGQGAVEQGNIPAALSELACYFVAACGQGRREPKPSCGTAIFYRVRHQAIEIASTRCGIACG